jgi:hypothetical protein
MLDINRGGRTAAITPSKRKRVYALVDALEARSNDPNVGEFAGGPLYGVEIDSLRAIVSEYDEQGDHRPEHIHRHVWETFAGDRPVVPLGAHRIVEDLESLRQGLHQRREGLAGELERVGECVEIQVDMRWDVADVFEAISDRDDTLREGRRRLQRGTELPSSSDESRTVGDLYRSALERERQSHGDDLEAALGDWIDEMRRLPCRDEHVMVRSACLVDRSEIEQFEIALFDFADRRGAEYRFDYTRPQPPSRFVDCQLEA